MKYLPEIKALIYKLLWPNIKSMNLLIKLKGFDSMEYIQKNINNFIYVEGKGFFEGNRFIASFSNFFKDIKKIIVNNINKLRKNKEEQLDELIKNTIGSLNNLGIILGNVPMLHDEFSNYGRINIMALFILEREFLFDYIPFIKELLDDFFNLILSKIEMESQEYEIIFEEYILKLFDQEQDFYINVVEPNYEYNVLGVDEILRTFFN